MDNLTRLRKLFARLPQVDPSQAPVSPLFISDRAMLTPESIFEYDRHSLRFLGPYDGGSVGHILLNAVKTSELAEHPLEYRPQRAERDESWESYQGVLLTLEVTNPNPDDPKSVLYLRALVVWSPAKARLDAKLRETNLQRLEASLSDFAGKLNRRPYTKHATAEKRLASLLNHHPARRFLKVCLQGEDRQLSLTFERHEPAVRQAAETDGRYLLVTNDETLDADEMLRLSKRRDVPEKRFATVKGPLEVRPVYVHKQERVLGLVFCSLVALLAYALLELESARTVGQLTASTIFAEFASLTVVVTRFADGSTLHRLGGVTSDHLTLLEALRLPPIEQYAILSC